MHTNETTLRQLAARVTLGDAHAAAELRQKLQPHFRRIASRALRATTAASALTRRIRAAADRLSPDDAARLAADPDRLADPVARSLCESVVGRLQARAGGQKVFETICD